MADDTQQEQQAAPETARQKHPRAVGEPTDYYPEPETTPNLFEIALVLGGTGATGPYTAGVLDFLIQALDEWEKICVDEDKNVPEAQWTVPHHHVRIRIITGTSGGGICSLLTARALHFAFPPAVDGTKDAKILAANPYYNIWVNDIKIDKLLDSPDLDGNPLPAVTSVLNGQLLVTIANDGLSYPSPKQATTLASLNLTKPKREYIHNPLPVIVTHTNLTGIPYRQQFVAGAVSAEYFTNHADYMRLYFGYSLPLTPDPGKLIPETPYVPLVKPGTSSATDTATPSGLPLLPWDRLGQFALGTAAIPGALPARQIARNGTDYAYRFVWDTVKEKYSWLEPDWSAFVPADGWDKYGFVSLDGGCTDNEPVALARQTLEGLTSPLRPQQPSSAATQPGDSETDKPWSKHKANRAIVLVDPLCEIPHNSPDAMSVNLTSTLPRAVDMFKQTSRFATADICDFLHPDVYNRFLVAPKRTNPQQRDQSEEGANALCGEGLGAFMGFLTPLYRHHDFMLGRFNCQAFLEGTFTLDSGNAVFKNRPSLATRVGTRPSTTTYNGPRTPTGEYPIIPLCGSATILIKEPDWPPKGSFDPKTIHKDVKKRARKIMKSLGQVLSLKWYQEFAFGFVVWWMGRRAADKFVLMVKSALQAKDL